MKKPGYFQSERAMAGKAFSVLGLKQLWPGIYVRHPLAFLTEAADDVCYAVGDIDDAFKLRRYVGPAPIGRECDSPGAPAELDYIYLFPFGHIDNIQRVCLFCADI